MIQHPNVIRTRPTVRLEHGDQKTVYVIETDLALSSDDPAYDEQKFNSLVDAVRTYLEAHPDYNEARIEESIANRQSDRNDPIKK